MFKAEVSLRNENIFFFQKDYPFCFLYWDVKSYYLLNDIPLDKYHWLFQIRAKFYLISVFLILTEKNILITFLSTDILNLKCI